MYTMVYEFSEWLNQELASRNMTQSDLARRAKLTRGAISHLVNGRNSPTAQTCQDIANAFDYPVDFVLRKANLLSDRIETAAELEEINIILSQLPPDYREDILEYARMRARAAEKRGDYAAQGNLGEP